MISDSDDGTRRILNFPAVVPCESISLSTLLPSLISLGAQISRFKSRALFSNKRSARNSIRLLEAIVGLFQEIPQIDSRHERSLVLCLSELHIVFQKLCFLLEDCARDDARLLLLMKSEDVSTHFRLLVRAVSVALDVMPITGLDFADEAKEVMEFVRKQSIETDFEVQKEDDRCRRKVIRILDMFEAGISPKSSELKRVLHHLGIRSWSDCHREFKFLHAEAGEACSSSDKRGFRFLRSLMALMIYSRCTLFSASEEENRPAEEEKRPADEEHSWEVIRSLNPDDFRCPISLEIMTDPVVLSSGHTYNRSSILKWFAAGNQTCPKTGKVLPHLELVPNQALKMVIKKYCLGNGIGFPELVERKRDSSVGENSLAAENAIQLVSSFLVTRLVAGTTEDQSKAAMEIQLLTKTSVFNRTCLVEAGAVLPLLNLACCSDPGLQETAMSSVLNLSKHSGGRMVMVENGGLETIVLCLNKGLTMKAKQHAAGALFYQSSVEENRGKIGAIPSAIPGLMKLLREGRNRAKKCSLVTIFSLLMHRENHQRLLRAGLVPLVAETLKSSKRDDLAADSLAVLASLGESPDGAAAIFAAGALPVILEILGSSNSRSAREYCGSLLLVLSGSNERDVVPILANNPSLMARLYSILEDGSVWGKKKASSLIRILHDDDGEGSYSAAAARPNERLVRVW